MEIWDPWSMMIKTHLHSIINPNIFLEIPFERRLIYIKAFWRTRSFNYRRENINQLFMTIIKPRTDGPCLEGGAFYIVSKSVRKTWKVQVLVIDCPNLWLSSYRNPVCAADLCCKTLFTVPSTFNLFTISIIFLFWLHWTLIYFSFCIKLPSFILRIFKLFLLHCDDLD